MLGLVDSDPRIGTVIDQRYRIIEQIAAGGMGSVYLAERVKLGRTVAIKFLHVWGAEHRQARRRFDVEARAMAKMDHPNCATVIDFGVVDSVPYVVMEYASGETLRKILDRGPLEVPTALDIIRQVLLGLAHAHERDIVHRDIKPANVMVGQATGVGMRVKLLDFGLARVLTSNTRVTAEGKVLGTPAYMAPEQTRAGEVDARSDVYACGVLLFEMLTGRKPFEGADAIEILQKQRNSKAPSLYSVTGQNMGPLEYVVARALEKEPDLRFQTAAEFARAIESARYPFMHGTGPATPDVTARVARTGGTSRLVVLGLVALLIAGVVVAVLTSGSSQGPARSSDAGAVGDASRSGDAGDAPPADSGALAELPELVEVRALIDKGRRDQAIQALQDIEGKHPGLAEAPYLLGQLYFRKLWSKNGMESYRRAIFLEPAYRQDKVLIDSVLRAFAASKSQRDDLAEFVFDDIGPSAVPGVRELAEKHRKKSVREHARRLLRRLEEKASKK